MMICLLQIKNNPSYLRCWLEKPQGKGDWDFFKSHGEGGDADMTAVERGLRNIQNILRQYVPKKMCNAEDCDIFP